jgi:hypothetical protein
MVTADGFLAALENGGGQTADALSIPAPMSIHSIGFQHAGSSCCGWGRLRCWTAVGLRRQTCDAKDRNLIRDRREIVQRRVAADGDMWTCPRGQRKIAAKDLRSLRRHDAGQHYASRFPRRSTARPSAARTLRTQFARSPSIDTRYCPPFQSAITAGKEKTRPLLLPTTSSAAACWGPSPAPNITVPIRFRSRTARVRWRR